MKRWIIVIVLALATMGAFNWLSKTQTEPQHVEAVKPPPSTPEKKATLSAGRVVELHTSKGQIDFVLFEKDCPITTKRIAELVSQGSYDGVVFGRVEPHVLIQCGQANTEKPLKGMPRELCGGLINTKGTVGMARTSDINSARSAFYILIEPLPHLNYEYTAFGRLIRGMDVVESIKVGDKIEQAKLRPHTEEDKKALGEVLQIESHRRVN